MTQSFAVGWRQVFVCTLLLAASGMVAPMYSVLSVPLGAEYRVPRAVLMLAMTVLSGTGAVLTPLLGVAMDRVPIRRLMVLGGVLLAAGYAAMSLTAGFGQVLLVFGLLIAPASVLIGPVAATVLLSRWFSERRGRAVGFAIAGVSIGGFLFPLIVTMLLEGHAWRDALRLLSLLLVAWTVPVALLVVDRPEQRGLHPDGAPVPSVRAQAERDRAPVSVRAVLGDPAFWLLAATVAIVTAGMKGMVTNLAPLATDVGIPARQAALLISIFSACSFCAKLSFAALADRLGPRILMFAALGGFSLGLACLTQASAGYGVIVLGVSLVGLLGGFMVPIESYVAPRVFGQRAVGRAMGMLTGVILLALLATPPLFGLIFDLTGSYTGIFWTFSGLAAVALLWLPAVRLGPREGAGEAEGRYAPLRREAGATGTE